MIKKKEEDITKGFLRGLFGKLIGDVLFAQNLARMGIRDFESLDTKQRVEIGQKIIENTFKNFYTKDKIENLKIFYLLRFSLNEASVKVQDMLSKDCEIKLEAPEELDAYGSEDLIKNMEDERNIKFVFEWSEMLEGDLVIVMNRETALKLSNKFIQVMMGITNDDNNFDEMKLSSINEFFNIILPVFSRVIGDAFNQIVYFTPRTYSDFKVKYYFNNQFVVPEKLIRTKISINFDQTENYGELFFFIKEATGRFELLLNQAQLYKDPFELSPPRLIVKLTGNTGNDINTFFDMLRLSRDNIDYILKKIYKPNFYNFEYSDYIKFTQLLISEFFPNASETKKNNIKFNLEQILIPKKIMKR